MADVLGAHERQDDEIVLLTLVLVHGGDLVRLRHPFGVGASFAQNVSDEMLLAVVRRQYGDLLARVADQTHVHVDRHRILGFGYHPQQTQSLHYAHKT